MKIRTDFVTNSSSSSFLVVGVQDQDTIKKIIKKDRVVKGEGGLEISHGMAFGDGIIYLGCCCDEAIVAGIEADEKLLQDKKLSEIKEDFKNIVKKNHNVKLPLWEIELIHGEFGNG